MSLLEKSKLTSRGIASRFYGQCVELFFSQTSLVSHILHNAVDHVIRWCVTRFVLAFSNDSFIASTCRKIAELSSLFRRGSLYCQIKFTTSRMIHGIRLTEVIDDS